jgi:hypothetical protein
MPMSRVVFGRDGKEMLDYLEKHDGKFWRYKYFTRPMIMWMAGNPEKREKENERKKWESE